MSGPRDFRSRYPRLAEAGTAVPAVLTEPAGRLRDGSADALARRLLTRVRTAIAEADLPPTHGLDGEATDYTKRVVEANDGVPVDIVLDSIGGRVFTAPSCRTATRA
ncbi:hypothetical protein [Asanoa siamensis]|uniref:Uncharacterized protein n=1 Tax=Asanoa siamensis TaxID=926357 RepID=A0ABQ4CMS5_9ACTN|nr:hypothetical protein [Asanoa siamensis]GIF72582.1 hypothetical protein Asi02nite_21000 [Asanoa siamensis]